MLKKQWEALFGPKINNTRVVPVTLKIVLTFTLFIFVSNIATNYVNIVFNRSEQIALMRELMLKDLGDLVDYANNQYEIYQFNQDLDASVLSMEQKAASAFQNEKSIALALKPDGTFLFEASDLEEMGTFADEESFNLIIGQSQSFINIIYNGEEYITVFKYNPKWDVYLIRGEELNEFYRKTNVIFMKVSVIILILTFVLSIVGSFLLGHILRFVRIFTNSIMAMINNQQMELIDLQDATNDDITFLGASFNSLSSTIDNLVKIFRKFATRDVAERAYKERMIKLEGSQKDLTILFSDIKGFTYITETLGPDIIKLLNMHYDKAIRSVLEEEGDIGSIIGDAILAVFGTRGSDRINKSMHSVYAAYKLQQVASWVRTEMSQIKEKIVLQQGALNEAEEKVYKAVLLEIGVGIDGGDVFYGNIGSDERMTNTVIGDNVNSSSRLEGLTRVYKVPVICSEYVKNDIEQNQPNHGIFFLEIDTVQVKGKTIGKKVYWPIPKELWDEKMEAQTKIYSEALVYYYNGEWAKANKLFKESTLPQAEVFKERTSGICPKNWKGIWAMKTK